MIKLKRIRHRKRFNNKLNEKEETKSKLILHNASFEGITGVTQQEITYTPEQEARHEASKEEILANRQKRFDGAKSSRNYLHDYDSIGKCKNDAEIDSVNKEIEKEWLDKYFINYEEPHTIKVTMGGKVILVYIR